MEFKTRVTTSLKFINKTVNLMWYIFRKAGLSFSNELQLISSKWIMSYIHSLLVKPSSNPIFTSITWIKYDIPLLFPTFVKRIFYEKLHDKKSFVRKIFRKTNISYPLIYTLMVRISGSEMFVFWKIFYMC